MSFTIAEDVQLMLTEQHGRLEYESVLTAAGALIELALLGRLSSEVKRTFFSTPLDRFVTVSDGARTGQPILDTALEVLVHRDKAWRADRALLAVRRTVSSAIDDSLALRGLARTTTDPAQTASYLEVMNSDALEARRSVLRRARTLPATVTDPRLGAVVDILRNGGNRFRGESGVQPHAARDWYPPNPAATIGAILMAEHFLTLSE